MTHRVSALVAAVAAVLALPAAAHAAKPELCLTGPMSFLTPVEGQPHDFDASCTTDPDGHDLVDYEWDLDGDGHFETSTGSSPFLTHTFTNRGQFLDATVNFALKVTDAAGESDVGPLPLRVTDAINSWFNFAPQLVNPGDGVNLSASIAPLAPSVFNYAWDLDGDGAFEHSSGLVSSASTVAPDVLGKHRIGLQVTDTLGHTSVVRREIEVLPRHPSRDQQPWLAPQNLGAQQTLDVQAQQIHEQTTPVVPTGPDAPAFQPEQQPIDWEQPVQPQLLRARGSRRGLTVWISAEKSTRYRLSVRLPAERAAGYGLARKRVTFATGYLRTNSRGKGSSTMRWTKGAYRVFRKVRFTFLDLHAKPVS